MTLDGAVRENTENNCESPKDHAMIMLHFTPDYSINLDNASEPFNYGNLAKGRMTHVRPECYHVGLFRNNCP